MYKNLKRDSHKLSDIVLISSWWKLLKSSSIGYLEIAFWSHGIQFSDSPEKQIPGLQFKPVAPAWEYMLSSWRTVEDGGLVARKISAPWGEDSPVYRLWH